MSEKIVRWQLEWNSQNQPRQCILPNNGTYACDYDKSGNLTRITDPEGANVHYNTRRPHSSLGGLPPAPPAYFSCPAPLASGRIALCGAQGKDVSASRAEL